MHRKHRQTGPSRWQRWFALSLIGIAQAAYAGPQGSRLFAPCVVCHEPQGWDSPDGNIPSLAGQQKRYLEKQLDVFASGARVEVAMQLVTKHPTIDKQQNVAALAGYLSAFDANPNPRIGQEIYTHICAAYHGFDGNGSAGNRVPRLAGQQYPYLRRQIEKAAQLHLDLAPPEMTAALRSLRDQEKDALADYASRLNDKNVALDSARSLGCLVP